MSYTPTSWNTGDTITASALNKIENGIANAGSAVIVHTNEGANEADAGGTLDKTFAEIYDALKNGTPVYVKTGNETSGLSSDYACGMGVLPVLAAIKYADTFRVYVSGHRLGVVSGNYYSGVPAVATFTASSASGYPSLTNLVSPSTSAVVDWVD